MLTFKELRSTPLVNARDPLYEAIYRQSIYLGAPIDELGRICEWLVDSTPDDDDSDHWMNVRPY